MSADETPIWEVIEEFKEKVKVQEHELKKRREKMEAEAGELEADRKLLEERAAKLDGREKELDARLADLVPREKANLDKEDRIKALEKEVRRREEEVQRSRVEMERRQVEITKREESITSLADRSAEYENDIRTMGEHAREMEAALIQDQEKIRQMLDELSTIREGLLAKGKVLADQEALLAEGRRIVLDEQKRFVGWEKALNEREESISRRTAERPAEASSEVAEEEEIRPEPAEAEEEAAEPPAPEPVPEPVMEEPTAPEPLKVEEPEEEPETPVFKASEPAPAEEDEPETPVFRASDRSSGPTCPNCRKAISEGDEKCPACGHLLKEATHPEEGKKKDDLREEGRDEPKKAVSIRKIIRRK